MLGQHATTCSKPTNVVGDAVDSDESFAIVQPDEVIEPEPAVSVGVAVAVAVTTGLVFYWLVLR